MDTPLVKPWYKTKTGVVFLSLLGLALAIVVLFLGMVSYYSWHIKFGDATGLAAQFSQNFSLAPGASRNNNRSLSPEEISKAIYKESPTMGTKNAPITILAFIDFECPFCQESYTTFKEVANTYSPVARVVFKHYPIQSLHPNSTSASLAAACAGNQNKFWPYYDRLFTEKKLDDASLLNAAANLKLDTKKFENCFRNRELENLIERDLTDGANFNVVGTPTYFVNGIKIEGAATREVWDTILQAELAGSKK